MVSPGPAYKYTTSPKRAHAPHFSPWLSVYVCSRSVVCNRVSSASNGAGSAIHSTPAPPTSRARARARSFQGTRSGAGFTPSTAEIL